MAMTPSKTGHGTGTGGLLAGARLSATTRIFAACGAAILGALLAVAAWLKPDPSGLGTHQQLGLPPCTWLMLWGIPCPTCGMTTSWSCLLEGDIAGSLQANPAGSLVALMAVVLATGLGWSAWRGSWVFLVTAGKAWTAAVLGMATLMLVFWIGRLVGWI
jgi:Protein of unknown function (DUF2752)